MSKETKAAEAETLWDRRADLAVSLLLAVLTVLLAWSGFQSSKWSGVQAINFSDAGRARVDSNALNSAGATQVSTDTGIFISWLEAAQPSFAPGGGSEGVTTGAGLAPFLYQNFPDRLRVAVDDWIGQGAAVSGGPLPQELDSYVVPALLRADELREEAAAFSADARDNNQQSDVYVLATVVFAAALFLAGISQKMASTKTQQLVFGFAIAVTIVGALIVLTQPIQLSVEDFSL